MFHARIIVTLRKSILDPQGKAVEHGIHSLGYENISDVRIGKVVELNVRTDDQAEAERICREVSDKLLANPVMEDYSVSVEEIKRV